MLLCLELPQHPMAEHGAVQMASAVCAPYLLNTMVSNIGNPEEMPVIVQMELRTRLALMRFGNDVQSVSNLTSAWLACP